MMFFHLSQATDNEKQRNEWLSGSLKYLQSAIQELDEEKDGITFVFGSPGIDTLACVLYSKLGRSKER